MHTNIQRPDAAMDSSSKGCVVIELIFCQYQQHQCVKSSALIFHTGKSIHHHSNQGKWMVQLFCMVFAGNTKIKSQKNEKIVFGNLKRLNRNANIDYVALKWQIKTSIAGWLLLLTWVNINFMFHLGVNVNHL